MPEGTGASKLASVWQTRAQGGEEEEEDKEKVKKTKVEMPEGTGASKLASVWQTRAQGGAVGDEEEVKKTKVEMPEGTGASKLASVWQTRAQGGGEEEKEKDKEKEPPTPRKTGPSLGSMWEKNVTTASSSSGSTAKTSEIEELKKMMAKEKEELVKGKGASTEPEIPVEGEEASKVLFGFMNKALDGIKGVQTPLDSEDPDSWTVLSDGISLCHFFDKVIPDALDLRTITKKISSDQDKIDNWNLCVQSARGNGCRLHDVKVNLLAEGDKDSIKKVIWQIIKTSCELKVRGKKDYLSTVIDDIDNAIKLPMEKLLLAWANAVVKKAGHNFSANSLTGGFKDVNMYIVLLHVVTGSSTDPLDIEDPLDLAIEAEANADGLEEGTVIIAEGILDGIYWMNYAFLSVLLVKAAEKEGQ